MENQNKVN